MPSRLLEVAALFTRLGFTAFGGPAAHIALIEDEVVNRRKWLDRQHFLDLVGALNFIPGPNSTELAIHLGLIRAGVPGLIVAGVCFITPAVLIILPIAWMYVHLAGRGIAPPPAIAQALLGVGAVVVAVLIVVTTRLIRSAITGRLTFAVAVAATAAELLIRRYTAWQSEIVVLALAATFGACFGGRPSKPAPAPLPEPTPKPDAPHPSLAGLVPSAASLVASWASPLGPLAWFFFKIGATLFGSGYVLVNYLETGLVKELRWLTSQQLSDAVAVGQVTPGPLLTTATFIGYVHGYARGGDAMGVLGAIVATVAIFLPAFVLVGFLGPLLPTIRKLPRARAALDAMNAAVVALLVLVTLRLAGGSFLHGAAIDPLAVALCMVSVWAMLKWNTNSTWLILLGGLAGAGRSLI